MATKGLKPIGKKEKTSHLERTYAYLFLPYKGTPTYWVIFYTHNSKMHLQRTMPVKRPMVFLVPFLLSIKSSICLTLAQPRLSSFAFRCPVMLCQSTCWVIFYTHNTKVHLQRSMPAKRPMAFLIPFLLSIKSSLCLTLGQPRLRSFARRCPLMLCQSAYYFVLEDLKDSSPNKIICDPNRWLRTSKRGSRSISWKFISQLITTSS